MFMGGNVSATSVTYRPVTCLGTVWGIVGLLKECKIQITGDI